MKFDLKKFKPKKMTVVIALVAVLACVAVFLNWQYQSGRAAADEAAALASEYETVEDRRILGGTTDVSTDSGADTDVLSLENELADTESVSASASSYFDATRLSRQKARDEAIGILESTAASANATEGVKTDAAAQISALARDTLVESRIEGLVTAKGYADCVAFVSDDGVNVVVAPPSGGLKSEDVARILDIVTGEIDVDVAAVKIVEAK